MKTQRGAAALPITLILSFAVLLAVMFANRSVLLQVRSSVHQLHTAEAHEAAQAGLAWAVAQLNRTAPIGEDCRPAADGSTWTWQAQAPLGPLQASCVAEAEGWACHCPHAGDARPVQAAAAPAFRVQLTADPTQRDRWQLSAIGHSSASARSVRLQQTLGRLPGLDTLPAAALTVRGNAHLGASLTVTHNQPASGGVTLLVGGNLLATAARIISTPGTPARASIVSDEPALAALGADGLHASVFRMNPATWREQPGVATVDCRNTCDAALAQAARDHTLIVLDGGLRLDTPLVVGSPERPRLLVVNGPVELHAAAIVHGLVYLRDPRWTDSAGITVRGAVIAEGELAASGPSSIHHDIAVLQTLQQRSGTYAPVSGSWRDL